MAQGTYTWRRPLIVGAGGQVGTALWEALQDGGSGTVLRTGRSASQTGWQQLDLANLLTPQAAAAALTPLEPDLIMCAGAMTFVDGCEEHPEQAFRTNAYGPAALAAYAHSRGIPFVFFSSDYVFDGTPQHPGPYAESAGPAPLSVYGQSKLEGERAILRVHPGALAVRTSWVYGPDPAGKNFVTSLVRQLRAGSRVRVPADQVSTPTFNQDLARVTLAAVDVGLSGLLHLTGPNMISRLALAETIARDFGLDPALIEGVPTSELGQRARRPLLSGLISHRLHEIGSRGVLRSLNEGLKAMAATTKELGGPDPAGAI